MVSHSYRSQSGTRVPNSDSGRDGPDGWSVAWEPAHPRAAGRGARRAASPVTGEPGAERVW